jgi:RNA polymerase sigma-70 factor (ECF subfamily)
MLGSCQGARITAKEFVMREDILDRLVALRPALCRQAVRLIGGRTQLGTPEDFVQDTMVTALQIGHRYDEDNLFGWLLAILDGHIRNASRRAWVRTSVPLMQPNVTDGDENEEIMIEVPVAASQHSTVELDDVLAVLQTLPEADQEIIRLSRFEGLSHEQIAEQLNVQLGTAYSRLSRATARLRAACEAAPGIPDGPVHSTCGRAA